MRGAIYAAAFTVYLLSNSSVFALSGNELLPKCQRLLNSMQVFSGGQFRYDGSPDSAECLGFIEAFHSLSYFYLVDYATRLPEKKSILRVCPPRGVGTVQMVRMFVKYANDHPADLNQDAIFLMLSTLSQNYSCPE